MDEKNEKKEKEKEKEKDENSEKLFNMFSKKILYQFSQEKHEIENYVRKRYDEEYQLKRENLEKENSMIRESEERKQKLDFEKRCMEQSLKNAVLLREQEKDLVVKYQEKILETDDRWKQEISKLKKTFDEELGKRDEVFRDKELKEQKDRFYRAEKQREEYENRIKFKYDELIEKYRQQSSSLIQQNTENFEKLRINLKKEKADFEMSVYQKFQKLLEQKEKDMKVLITDRENQLLNYDHQKNLKLLSQLKEKERERIEKEKVLHGRYENQITDIKEISKKQINSLLKQLEDEKTEKNALQNQLNQLELKIRKIKHNMDMWKLEYHKSTMEKFKKLLFEIELNAKKEMENFSRKQIQQYESHLLLELKQKDHELKLYEKKEKDFKMQLMQSKQLRSEKSISGKSKEEGVKQVKQFKLRLIELWEALDISYKDRFKFIWSCHSFNNFTTESLMFFRKEIGRLTDQLPLQETIKRREFIKKRIKEVFRSTNKKINETKLNELNVELKRLNNILLKNLQGYEQKWNEVFFYGNQSYLKIMSSENRMFH